MNLLPKLLYLFRALPLIIPKTFINNLQEDVNRFIWQDKRPRFSRQVLYRSQSTGGLGLPNLWLYFLAAHFSQIIQWNIPNSKVPWVKFESNSICSYCLPYTLWSPSNCKLFPLNSIVTQSLILWNHYKSKFSLISSAPQGSSFLGEPSFTPDFDDPDSFSWWQTNSLFTIADLQIGGAFATFDLLHSQKQIPHQEHYHYVQIRYFYTSHYSLSPYSPLIHPLNGFAMTLPEIKASFQTSIKLH